MIKLKQSIQINNDINTIMGLPCVIGCQKVIVKDNEISLVYILFGDTRCTRYYWGEQVNAFVGEWLCEDCNGVWHLLTDKEYQRINSMEHGKE